MLRILIAALFLVHTTCVQVAHAQTAGPPCTAVEGGGWVGPVGDKLDSIVVFVHGLGGDAVGTWTDGYVFNTLFTTYWPCIVREDPAFTRSNVFVYEYPSSIRTGSTPVRQMGQRLYDDLAAKEVFKYRHVTFVAHSLGGLVVSQMLLSLHDKTDDEHRAALRRVRHVMFYGVPATGNDLAKLVSYFGASQLLDDIANSARAAEVVRRWHSVRWPFSYTCLAEGSGTSSFSGVVVSRESAFAFCEQRPTRQVDLDGLDHSQIVKPRSVHKAPHRRLATDYLLCVAPRIAKPTATTPAIQAFTLRLNAWLGSIQTRADAATTAAQRADVMRIELANNPGSSFVMPKDGRAGIQPEDFEFQRAPKLFAQQAAEQLLPRLSGTSAVQSVRILSVLPLKDLPVQIDDRAAHELRQALLANQVMTLDGLVALLESTFDAQRLIMLFDTANSGAAKAAGEELRGFLIVPRQPDCSADASKALASAR